MRLHCAALVARSLASRRARRARGALARGAGRPAPCLRALDRLGIDYGVPAPRDRDGVEVLGNLGGIEYRSYNRDPLVLDCSLVYSLARSGAMLRARGVERVSYSSAYQRRNIRGTSRPSRHSFGLAIDIHTFALVGGETFAAIRADYEQGLGDASRLRGRAAHRAGRALARDRVRAGPVRVCSASCSRRTTIRITTITSISRRCRGRSGKVPRRRGALAPPPRRCLRYETRSATKKQANDQASQTPAHIQALPKLAAAMLCASDTTTTSPVDHELGPEQHPDVEHRVDAGLRGDEVDQEQGRALAGEARHHQAGERTDATAPSPKSLRTQKMSESTSAVPKPIRMARARRPDWPSTSSDAPSTAAPM